MENLRLKALEIPTHPKDGINIEALRFARVIKAMSWEDSQWQDAK